MGEAFLAGTSPAITRLRGQIERVSRTPRTTVLLHGRRGLERTAVARAIHERSEDAGPFVIVECSSCPVLFESTDLLERCRGGTLFLNELSALPQGAQAELLQHLERRASSGAHDPDHRGDPRIIATTAVSLDDEAEAGRLRADLLYRVNVLTIRLPTLRERIADLPELASTILRRHADLLGVRRVLSGEALERLRTHAWPGDLFELESVLALAFLRADGETIEAHHLALSEPVNEPALWDDALIPASAGRSLREIEEVVIRRVLREESGNRSSAARALGINRQTLYNKLRRYGIA